MKEEFIPELERIFRTQTGETLQERFDVAMKNKGIDIKIYQHPIYGSSVNIDTTIHDERVKVETIEWIIENIGLDCYDCPVNACFYDKNADCKTELLKAMAEDKKNDKKPSRKLEYADMPATP